MKTVRKTFLLSVIAGVVLFMWGFLVHAVLPLYDSAYQKFTDEAAMSNALRENAPQTGIYYLPYSEADRAPGKPEAFVNVLPQGPERTLASKMLLGLTIQVVSAFLVISLVLRSASSTYWHRVGLFSFVGFIVGFTSHAYYWNWFEFPSAYVIPTILDASVAWTLAGMAVAKFITREGVAGN